MLKHTKGDLLNLAEDGEFDIVVQGCNCFCTMGSGIARQIREHYPDAYASDLHTVAGDIDKLGNYSIGRSSYIKTKFAIVNAYTQFDFNRAGESNDLFEYSAFELILKKLAHKFGTANYGFPYIGMGLAGGDKTRIMAMLENFAEKISAQGGSVTLVEFSLTQ
jgi:O-acetyl-ADP-ribose deacetylase (regulator of RNase III)